MGCSRQRVGLRDGPTNRPFDAHVAAPDEAGPAAALVLLTTACLGAAAPARAVEDVAGVYALGNSGPLASFVPNPGFFLTDDLYCYSADADAIVDIAASHADPN